MTTIKNKQTGETLTGETSLEEGKSYVFKINGCNEKNGFSTSEWEILPPPLPTGIGAVVRDSLGNVFVRIFRNSANPWQLVCGERRLTDQEVVRFGAVTVLSEGVTL